MSTHFSHSFVLIPLIGHVAFGQVREAPMRQERVPGTYSISNKESLHDLWPHLRACLDWPSEDSIQAMQVPQDDRKVQWAIQDTKRWLSVMLRAEWVPMDASVEILALKGAANGDDAIRLRFKADAYVIQVTSTSWSLSVAIGQSNGSEIADPKDVDAARAYAVTMIERFFNYSDKIVAGNHWKLKQTKAGVQASSEMASDWWQVVDWWTNGTAFVFSAPKLDSTVPRLPPGIPNWFTKGEREHVLPPLPKQ